MFKIFAAVIYLLSTSPPSAAFFNMNVIKKKAAPAGTLESFEYGSTACPTGWTVQPGSNCTASTSYAVDGSYSLRLCSGMDYGDSSRISKSYDLTNVSTIQVQATHLDQPDSVVDMCIELHTSSGPIYGIACTGGVRQASITTTGQISMDVSDLTGTYYVLLKVDTGYAPGCGNFDSLRLLP